MQANIFLESVSFCGIPLFEEALLAYKQEVTIFKMLPVQFFMYKIEAYFVPNSKLLPGLAQFSHVSAVLQVYVPQKTMVPQNIHGY